MKPLSSNPILYEINTFVWLGDLTRKYQRPVALGNVPAEEWSRLADMGIEMVWLMGVWERSPAAVDLVRQNPVAIEEFKRMLPDYQDADLSGSPYSIRDYLVHPVIGGDAGLAAERAKLAPLGIRLILDFVPNHLAPDHPWTLAHPEFFIQGAPQDLIDDPEFYIQIGGHVLARGRDPNFPAWMDVVQLNAFHPGLRAAAQETLLSIAGKCDGMRVDMAMLFINRIFEATWGSAAGAVPDAEFWPGILEAVKTTIPGTIFIAEAYWDTEKELLEAGFDYCYDKKLYDHLKSQNPRKLAAHLRKVLSYQSKLVRFTENHDEQRARTAFPGDAWQVAALVTSTLPGMRMFHDGQFEGRRAHISVLLGRHPDEPADINIQEFYKKLLTVISLSPVREGVWSRQPLITENGSRRSHACLAWSWENDSGMHLVVVNLSKETVTVGLDSMASSFVDGMELRDIWSGEKITPSPNPIDQPKWKITISPMIARIFEISRHG